MDQYSFLEIATLIGIFLVLFLALFLFTVKTKYKLGNRLLLNALEYELLRNGNVDSAIKIFSLNVSVFPQSANVYDSLGEAYFNKKEYQVSIDHYKKAISLGGTNGNAEKMIEKIEKEMKK